MAWRSLGMPRLERVPVVAGVVGRLGQLLDGDVGRRAGRGCRSRGRSRRPGPPCLHLQRVDDGEDVRRKRRDPAELHPPKTSPARPSAPRTAYPARPNCYPSASESQQTGADGPGVGRPGRRPRCGTGGRCSKRQHQGRRAPSRVGARSSSPASARPPPTTTTSGSSRFSRFAMPRATHQAKSAMMASASGSPSAAAR